ncbi:Internalin-I, partial [Diplonema papillatum]
MEAPVSPSLASAPSTADVEGGKEETKVLDRKLIAKKLSPDQIEEGLEKACSVDLSGLRLAGSVRRGDALDACANLRTVNFSDNLLTEDDFGTDPLLLKQLRELVADGNRLTRVPRASWGTPGLPCLQHLSLANNSIESLVGFNALPLLRSLNLEGNRVASVKNLELAHLEVLNLSRNRIREVSGLKMARLEELKLAHNELTCFPGAERMAALRELDVSHNEIDELVSDTFASRRTTVALSPLRVLQHLTSLNARFNKLSSLAFLPPLPHLTELLLGHNRMGTPGPGAPPAPETAARAKSGAEIGRADDIGDAGYLTEEEEGEGGEEKGGPPSVRSGCSAASSAKRAVAGGPGRGRPVPSAAAAAAAGKVGAKRGAGGAAQKQRSGVSGSPAAAAPAAANLRRASKSDAGSASSTVSTAAAGGGGGSGARKNFIRQFPGHFPCLAVLDVSQNPGLVGSAEALRPLAKCKDLYDLRVAGSIAIGADDPNHLMRDIFGQVPHLDVIDGYTVVKVNRLEINDVDASATAAASPQEEITFTRT